jgi:hypothetical protein
MAAFKDRNKDRLSYELAEAMLSEYTDTWKLGFIDYLIEQSNSKS